MVRRTLSRGSRISVPICPNMDCKGKNEWITKFETKLMNQENWTNDKVLRGDFIMQI